MELLLDYQANPDHVDEEEGWTALMFAAAEGNDKVVKTLLRHNADRTIVDEDGDTALDFARDNQHRKVVNILLNSE